MQLLASSGGLHHVELERGRAQFFDHVHHVLHLIGIVAHQGENYLWPDADDRKVAYRLSGCFEAPGTPRTHSWVAALAPSMLTDTIDGRFGDLGGDFRRTQQAVGLYHQL